MVLGKDRKGKSRALDLLDKHLNEKNKSRSPTMSNRNSELENLLRKDRIVSSPDTTMESRGGDSLLEDMTLSPTPKRKAVTSTAEALVKRRRVFSVNELASQPSEPDYSAPLADLRPKLTHSQSETTTESPSSKSVAFSDHVGDDSEIRSTNSSPRHSPISKPRKSILRNTPKTIVKSECNDNGNSLHLSSPSMDNEALSLTRDPNIGPDDIKFWVSGEIHSLMNPQSVQEFTKLFNGAIKILSLSSNEEYAEKKFEVYASLNNILSNGALKNTGDVNERKILCVTEHFPQITDICIKHLEEEQVLLIKNDSKKDPFSIRLYVQIMKFFTNLLSSYKIIRYLVTKEDQAEKCKRIFKQSIDVLQHKNSNKVMINTQLNFLREEKFSTQLLDDTAIDTIISALSNIKEIPSTNVICEKLMILKQFLVKYPKKMVAQIPSWLPQDVICRILFSSDQFSTKIGFAAISVLLELLKRCIDHPAAHEKVFQCLQVEKAKDILPQIYHKSFFSSSINEHPGIDDVTVSYLLRSHILNIILEKKEYKLAMDLWLALMGLLFNNKKRITFLLTDEGKKWIDLNIECLKEDSPKSRLLSLKVWRIMIFCISNNHKYLESHELIELVSFLIKPIKTVLHDVDQESTFTGINYLMNDYVFSTCGITHQQGNYQSVSYLLTHLWKPIVDLILEMKHSNSKRHELISQWVQLLLAALGRQSDDESYRGLHPIKVIASEGIQVQDIAVIPPQVFATVTDELYNIILPIVIQDHEIDYSIAHLLIIRYIEKLSASDKTTKALYKSISLLSALYQSNSADQNVLNLIIPDIVTLAITFKNVIFSADPLDFRNFILSFDPFISQINEGLVSVVKILFEQISKENISGVYLLEGILSLQDTSCDLSAINWVGSKLLAETVHEYDFLMYSRIVAKIGEPETISNFFDLAEKLEFNVDLEDLLQINVWNSAGLVSFLELYIAKFKIDILDLLHLLKKSGKISDLAVFDYFFELVPEQQKLNVLKDLIIEYPNLISAPSLKNSNFLLRLVLSLDHLKKLLPYLRYLSNEVRLEILDRMIRFDMLESILYYKDDLFKDYLLKNDGSSLDSQRESLQINLISYILDKKCLELLLFVKDLPLLETTNEYLYRRIEKSMVEEMLFIPPDVLLTIDDNNLAKINFTDMIRIFLETKPANESLELIKLLIHREKVTMITRCKNEIFDYFVGLNNTDDMKTQQNAIKLFSDMISMVFSNRKKVDIGFFSQFVARLPNIASKYLYDLSLGFTQHQQFRAGKFRNSNSFSDLKNHLMKWSVPIMDQLGLLPLESEYIIKKEEEQTIITPPDNEIENEIKYTDTEKGSENDVIRITTSTQQIITQKTLNPPHIFEGNAENGQHSDLENGDNNTDQTEVDQMRKNSCVDQDVKDNSGDVVNNNEIQKLEMTKIAENNENLEQKQRKDISMDAPGPHSPNKIGLPDPNDTVIENHNTLRSKIPKSNGPDFEYNNVEDPLIAVKIPIFKGSSKKRSYPGPAAQSDFDEKIASGDLNSKPNVTLHKIPIYNMGSRRKIEPNTSNNEDFTTEKPLSLAEEKVVSESPNTQNSKLKIPIFNSSLFSGNGSQQMILQKSNHPNNLKSFKQQGIKEDADVATGSELLRNEEDDYLLNEIDDSITIEDIQGIKKHFPSRKARKLISRLRNINSNDISTFSAEETRNVRIELLDFLMKLEYHTINDHSSS
ncbi:hypothetical protein RNJ44_00034 [Nakaseomyces bracarensis]|uniref:Telomere-associated protein Rif1 N-terminal domain-containing protein n=1 Tax=Nakaseomyces bracarensis TaxID=273131 RepID=A0ABR4P0X1_9SACH